MYQFNGQPLEHCAYNAWGQRNFVYTNGGSQDLLRFGYNARWGYKLDSETGLYYCQNRYYDPGNGRWLTRDPIGYAGGANLYGYCGGGPVNEADPSGEVRIKVVSYRVFGPGWHRGILVEDNMGTNRKYSFAGGPEQYDPFNFGDLRNRSGEWDGSQDERHYHYNRDYATAHGQDVNSEVRVITLIDDCSSYDLWIGRLKRIEAIIAKFMPRSYAPLPSETPIDNSTGPQANSNSWFSFLVRKSGLQDEFDHANKKAQLPWAPGIDIKFPFNPTALRSWE